MRVHAGSVILEPGLNQADFAELAANGVRLAKAGFGAVETAYDYVPLVAAAKGAGLVTTCHTGGSSIPGSGAITGDHLLAMRPHVSFHINGGPTAMPDADFGRVIVDSDIALQVCTAGNLRTTLLCARLAEKAWRLRPFHHWNRYADRLGHHAARHALYDCASCELDRYGTRAVHLCCDR
jgi:enamidase